jgi:hypothetical protein
MGSEIVSTLIFNSVLRAVARRLKAERTLATDDAGAYTSVLLTEYVNRAIKDLLIDKYLQLGDDRFRTLFPEYVKTSGALTLSGGVVAKPNDAFVITNLSTSGGIEFKKLKQSQVEDVRRGTEMIIVPSASRPVFWEEAGNIYTLGVTSGDVVARYIQTPADITPSTVSAGNGNFNTATGAYTSATRTLVVSMNANFTASDINKTIIFRSATVTYLATIESCSAVNTVVLRAGNGLPAGDVATVAQVMVSDLQSEDLKINPYFHADIINRAVAYGLMDAQQGVIK